MGSSMWILPNAFLFQELAEGPDLPPPASGSAVADAAFLKDFFPAFVLGSTSAVMRGAFSGCSSDRGGSEAKPSKVYKETAKS